MKTLQIQYRDQPATQRIYLVGRKSGGKGRKPRTSESVPGVMASFNRWSAWGKDNALARAELLKMVPKHIQPRL